MNNNTQQTVDNDSTEKTADVIAISSALAAEADPQAAGEQHPLR